MRKYKLITIILCFVLTCLLTTYTVYKVLNTRNNNPKSILHNQIIEVIDNNIKETSILITAVGDCTLGSHKGYTGSGSLPYELKQNNNDYSYFFKGVYDITSKDDLTIANLETTFTNATKPAIKKYTFKGPSDYANILTAGSVEIVNIANNHTYDYLEKGYNDTINTLDEYKINYFGSNIYKIMTIKGIKIGFIGYYTLEDKNIYKNVDNGLKYLKDNNVDLIIVSFHWGIERKYQFRSTEQKLGRYVIDNGADLVIGHHTHTLQGIEKYKDKYIIYSLGNFVFGGNHNPLDKDAYMFQQQFNFTNDKLNSSTINIIPVSVSRKTSRNDYQPQILTGSEYERVFNKIKKYSFNLDYN